MINSQWKALHLGRWELLFKIMDEGSITRVADIENLQRSQLSRMVSGLEEELGVQLLERRGKRLNPTQAALELRSKIEPHIVRVRRALEKTSELEEGDKGSIRFGAMPGFLQTQVVPLIAEFQQLHPQVTFDVIGDDNPKAFMGGECDLMLYYGPVNDANLVENWVIIRSMRLAQIFRKGRLSRKSGRTVRSFRCGLYGPSQAAFGSFG